MMADYFASIFGTEKDKVNCSFYFKIGACRHGDRCSRVHNKPSFSQTILIQNLYVNLQNSVRAQGNGQEVPDGENQKHFDEFYEDIYVELEEKYGPIEEMNVCDNLGDHLIGNVYVKFKREEDAEKAVDNLNNRWFAGKPVYAELSTVTDFREAACRQYDIGACERAGQCNFMHIKKISDKLKRHLFGSGKSHRSGRHSSRRSHISRSRSGSKSRSPSTPRMSRDQDRVRSRSRSLSSSPKSSSRRKDYYKSSHRSSHRRHRHRSKSPKSRSSRSRTRSKSPASIVITRSRTRSPSRSPTSQSKSSRRSRKSSRRHC